MTGSVNVSRQISCVGPPGGVRYQRASYFPEGSSLDTKRNLVGGSRKRIAAKVGVLRNLAGGMLQEYLVRAECGCVKARVSYIGQTKRELVAVGMGGARAESCVAMS